MNILRSIKNTLVPDGERPVSILTGPFRGLRLNLNLRTQSQFALGLFERELYPALEELSRDIRSAVDVGAAYGEYTVYFLRKTPAERVIAFEPLERLQNAMTSNLRLNGVEHSPKLEFLATFLGSQEGPGYTAANWLASRILSPCLIKMDIDGGETAVLRSASEVLKLPGIRWLIETHSVSLEKECVEILEANGYTVKIIDHAWWRVFVPEQRISEQNRWLTATKSQ